MKKSGITLIEMSVAMVLSAVILVALTYQIASITQFKNAVQDKIDAEREAYFVVRNMSDMLRFAIPNSNFVLSPNTNPQTLDADIAANRLTSIPAGGRITYSRNINTHSLSLTIGTTSPVTLSNYVDSWNLNNVWDSNTNKLIIDFSITKNKVTIPVRTTIKVIGS